MMPWFFLQTARAHAPGLSYAELDAAHLDVVFASAEAPAVPPAVHLTQGGSPCVLSDWAATPIDDAIAWQADIACAGSGPITYHADFLAQLAPGHRHHVTAGEAQHLLDAGSASIDISALPSLPALLADYGLLGIEHILTGWDHLAFLLALLLVVRSMRHAIGLVTGFSLAHALTLTLGAFGFVAAPAWIVEPAIAASIVLVAIDNLVRDEPTSHRLAVAIGLGLLHGFGFAGMLAELGLPPVHALPALLAFHGGVELGQLAVVLPIVPLLLHARTRPVWPRWGVPALSTALAALGAITFVWRILPIG